MRLTVLLLLTACGTATDTSSTDTGSGDTSADDTGTGDTADTGKDTADTANDTADTGKDTADTGSDTGKDTADTGTDTGDTSVPPDTGDTSVPPDTGDTGTSTGCTEADLILSGEVRSAGAVGTSFGPKDALTMVAIVTNLCPMDVTFTTPSTCLFTGWSVTSSSGMGSGMAVACAGVVTTWTVPAGGTLEEGQAWGRLAVDTYVLDVTADIPAATATTSFSVI